MKHKRKTPAAHRRPDRPATNKAPEAMESPLSARARWRVRLLALALPFIALAGSELVLRLAGYGYNPNFFLPATTSDGRPVLINNDRFTERFFPPELARWPDTFEILRTKRANTYRIFVLGESAAMGDPQPAFAASRYLEVLLRERFPQQKFEVVNLGITAINSHVILPIARDCAARGSGDLWILYIGNNEMVGPFGAASVFGSRAPPITAVRLNLALQRTRIGQWMVALYRKLGRKSPNGSWGGMEMFMENQVPPSDPRRETVYDNFGSNLQDIVQAGLESGAKVALNTMAVNLKDSPPFASQNNSNLPAADLARFREFYAAGLAASPTNLVAATECFSNACRIDPQFADAHFRWAECLLAASNRTAAQREFQLACDTDALPFRADSRINTVIRTLATNRTDSDLTLCDAERALADATPDGMAGTETFYEHVHFRWDGNYRLGRLWAEEVAHLLPEPVRAADRTNWETEAFCEQAIGLSPWNKTFVLKAVLERMERPPLSVQDNNASRVAALQQQLAGLRQQQSATGAVARVQGEFVAALQRNPADVFLRSSYANFLEANGERAAALEEYRQITALFPHDYNALVQTGRLLGESGNFSEARRSLDLAAKHRPLLPDPWYGLGVILAANGNPAEALKYFERAIQIRPDDANFLAQKAKMLAKLGRSEEAIHLYRQAIQLKPDWWEVHFELAGELAAANAVADSIHEYEESVRLNPKHLMSHMNLGVMLVRQNRLDEAVDQFQIAQRLDPDFAPARDYLRQVNIVRNQTR